MAAILTALATIKLSSETLASCWVPVQEFGFAHPRTEQTRCIREKDLNMRLLSFKSNKGRKAAMSPTAGVDQIAAIPEARS